VKSFDRRVRFAYNSNPHAIANACCSDPPHNYTMNELDKLQSWNHEI
jgi:hypothetical protein